MSEPIPAPAPAPTTEPKRPVAWQPFTPRGIAAFAPASFGRLFVFQTIVALLAAGAVVWFLLTVWFPVVRESIGNLPGNGAIRSGSLEASDWRGERLATNRFLTFAIDTETGLPHSFSADMFVVFRRSHYDVCSLFGCASFVYPVANAPFDRLELKAKWGAWEPILLGIAAIGTALSLLFAWWILASLYFLFVWIFAFFSDRQLTLGGSWRLCGTALLSGAILLTAAVVAYGFGALDLIRLVIAAILHIIVPWVLIVFATLALPRVATRAGPNPFTPASAKPPQGAPAPPAKP